MNVKIQYAYVAPGVIVSDSRGRSVFGLNPGLGEATLLLLDLEPDTAWPHQCFYILTPASGDTPLKVDHSWPPSEALELRPCR